MAGLIAVAAPGEIALAAGTAKTVLMITAAANHRDKLKEWGVAFDGVSVTAEPVQVKLQRYTTAGVFTALTPKIRKPAGAAETVQTTAGHTATTEPTAGDELASMEVHPQQGYHCMYQYGDEIELPGSGRVGIECTAPAVVNVRPFMVFEE